MTLKPPVQIDMNKPETVTHENVAALIASAFDDVHLELIITASGIVRLQERRLKEHALFNPEPGMLVTTWARENDYAGRRAAKDRSHVNATLELLRNAWGFGRNKCGDLQAGSDLFK